MPNQLSHLHSVLTINGSRVEGLAEGDPVTMPDITLFETKRGRDGTMYSQGTGAKGGEVMVKLLPSSRTAAAWLKLHAEIQAGTVIVFSGSWSDNQNGYSTLLRGGVLKSAPSGLHPGQDASFTFDFEEVIPQTDGANFDPAPIFA